MKKSIKNYMPFRNGDQCFSAYKHLYVISNSFLIVEEIDLLRTVENLQNFDLHFESDLKSSNKIGLFIEIWLQN